MKNKWSTAEAIDAVEVRRANTNRTLLPPVCGSMRVGRELSGLPTSNEMANASRNKDGGMLIVVSVGLSIGRFSCQHVSGGF